jgi:2-polyprenyl-6-methoxyphenol hydroxylase-like FAD-dependent oxidoreductase
MQHDVLIAGAGPTGLALGLWLTRQGIKVRIVDKASAPGTTSRAMVVHARTLELYRQLDLAEAVVAQGNVNPAVNAWVKGKRRAHLSFDNVGRNLTPYPYLLVYPQDRHERQLVSKLEELGVTVERNTEIVGFEDQGDQVVAQLRTRQGAEDSCAALYLAGCDGARSTVRGQLGTGFPGGTYSKTFYVADVEISGPTADGEVHIALDTSDFVAVLSYEAPGKVRLIGTASGQHDGAAEDLTFDDVGHRAIASLNIKVEKVNWFSTYRVHHRVTDHYRAGRVFLLGDAAHIHSPVGGQGMNTGIGDAINLAWKLAAVVKRQAPEALLDTYEVERRAFAEKLVQTTDKIFTFATADGDFADFVRTKIAPLLIPIISRPDGVREYMFRVVSQTLIEYRNSPTSAGTAGSVHGGDRLPWVRTADGDNYDRLKSIEWQAHVYGEPAHDVVRWCEERRLPLHTFAWDDAHERSGLARDALYLLRPDTYVALAEAHPTVHALEAYAKDRGLVLGAPLSESP